MLRTWTTTTLMILCATLINAQGRTDWVNVESPQVHPIEVARIDGHDYLLVCNTPDNSVEIYDAEADRPSEAFLGRVPVGLRPVSVRYHAALKRFYTANFLGDTVSMVAVSAPAGPDTLQADFLKTTWVLDEATDVAFYSPTIGGTTFHTIITTQMTLGGYSIRFAETLDHVAPSFIRIDPTVDGDIGGAAATLSLKEPRVALVENNDRLLMLGTKGADGDYDFGIFCNDLSTFDTDFVGGLGHTNFNMILGDPGELFVVGGRALNEELVSEDDHREAETGFVEWVLYRVTDPCSADVDVVNRDLNEKIDGGPVPADQALSIVTDVAALRDESGVAKLLLTGFGSDRVGVLTVDDGSPIGDWALRTIDVKPVPNEFGRTNPVAGPRGVAVRQGRADDAAPLTARAFVVNRLDNSVVVYDAVSESKVDEFLLQNDPTPGYVRAGQQFLYSTKFGNGFNACASCHTDGRTDGLLWQLSPEVGEPVPIPNNLIDAVPLDPQEWAVDKGFLVTQSLQGLLDFEVPQEIQRFFTNAPYHWRGDRADFTKFNPAFVDLLGGERQLTKAEMSRYERFINSVHYPPNPKQPLERRFTGVFGDIDEANILGSSTLAQRGLKAYHVIASGDGRGSCNNCHTLPTGSNSLITEFLGQPLETAALRGLFQKDARLEKDGFSFPPDSPFSGFTGMTHIGSLAALPDDPLSGATINGFNRFFFEGAICGPSNTFCPDLQTLNEFVHQLDWGMAPIVGPALTVDEDTPQGLVDTGIMIAEGQALSANAGLAVLAWIDGEQRGFWFDATTDPPLYREEPTGTDFTSDVLIPLGQEPGNRLVLQPVPLGSARRVANPSGVASQIVNPPSPSDLALLPAATNIAYENVPHMTTLWDGIATDQSYHVHTVQAFQHGLLNDSADGFGLTKIQHEAPRRLVVAGRDIEHGAKLHLHVPNDPDGLAPNTELPPGHSEQVETLEFILPIFATEDLDPEGREIWQTAAELSVPHLYILMLGGEFAQGVQQILTDDDPPFASPIPPAAGTFDPDLYNWHWVEIVQRDGSTRGSGGWQRFRIVAY